MSNTTKSKKEKEIITEYESQVKGKKNTVAPDGHLEMDSSDASNTNLVHALHLQHVGQIIFHYVFSYIIAATVLYELDSQNIKSFCWKLLIWWVCFKTC